MALTFTTVAAIAHGASAFVPIQSSMRAQGRVAGQRTVITMGDAPADASAASTSTVSAMTLGVAAAGVAGIGAMSSSRKQRRVATRALGLTEEVGVCAPFYTKFDPLNLGSDDTKMERYTAVEIKHGRIAMLACVGYVMPEFFHFPGCEGFANGLGALSTIPVEGTVQLIAFLGAHEILVKPREGGMGSYDFGLGTELLVGIDDEELNRKQTVERNNGRLAMIGIMGLMVQDGMFGTDVMTYMKKEGWWGEPVDWLVKDIPICSHGCALLQETRNIGLTSMRAFVYEKPIKTKQRKMSPACPFLEYPQQLDGWVGGEKGFDPLGASIAMPVYQLREMELKHGRVCMLATIGWIATDLGVRFPGEVFQNATSISAHDDCVYAGYMQPFLGFIGVLELWCFYLYWQGQSNWYGSASPLEREAGDFFVGRQFMPQDKATADEMRLKELENGRLAMLAFSGIVTQAVAFGKPWPFL